VIVRAYDVTDVAGHAAQVLADLTDLADLGAGAADS
jgi:hypothetical protein